MCVCVECVEKAVTFKQYKIYQAIINIKYTGESAVQVVIRWVHMHEYNLKLQLWGKLTIEILLV